MLYIIGLPSSSQSAGLFLKGSFVMLKLIGIIAAAALLLSGCAVAGEAQTPSQEGIQSMSGYGTDATFKKSEGGEVIYLAGGCFWGLEKLLSLLPGVSDAVSGYANGTGDETPTYEAVCRGGTGYRETVRAEYDPLGISLEQILSAYFLAIDPTVRNKQGNDVGEQYQTGIYYADDASAEIVEYIAAQEAKRYEVFAVEHGPLTRFYDAEEYHQDYLEKNPGGYCHISPAEIDEILGIIEAERSYSKPTGDELKASLTKEQYEVTQHAATERAFTGEYWDFHGDGIYVDVVTGQPLFSSRDKYDSDCGWPSFTAPILAGSVAYASDGSHGMQRTEVTSSLGGAHLGHIFTGDGESPNGVRYCINSASLRFVAKEDMASEGYAAYLPLLG